MKQPYSHKGILLMTCAGVIFCIMSALIKSAPQISTFKTVFFRFVVGLGILGFGAMLGRFKLRFVRGGLLFWRGLVGGIAVFIFFLSITKLGVGKGSVFVYAYPIFASIFSALILKERILLIKWMFIAAAFAGLTMLATGKGGLAGGAITLGFYELIAVGGAIMAGAAVVMVKKLHDSDDSYAIFFAQCLVGFWVFLVPSNLAASLSSYSEGILLVAIGVIAATGQLLMTEGYRHVAVTTGSLLNMLVPVLNFVVAVAIFREPLTGWEIGGAVIVILSCVMVIISDRVWGVETNRIEKEA
jgi:drug/metabolite transporter (DMT)-like permease